MKIILLKNDSFFEMIAGTFLYIAWTWYKFSVLTVLLLMVSLLQNTGPFWAPYRQGLAISASLLPSTGPAVAHITGWGLLKVNFPLSNRVALKMCGCYCIKTKWSVKCTARSKDRSLSLLSFTFALPRGKWLQEYKMWNMGRDCAKCELLATHWLGSII